MSMSTGEILTLLAARGFDFKHALGQHFLNDDDVLCDILDASGVDKTSNVLEIGPGAGIMTGPLAARAGQVLALELDRALLPVLDTVLHGIGNVRVVQGDVTKIDLAALLHEHFGDAQVEVVSNLPYSITTPILQRLFAGDLPISRLSVMVQTEAAQRIVATPGGKEYGPLSLLAQYRCAIQCALRVQGQAFVPPPHVESTVLSMQMRPYAVLPKDERAMLSLFRNAFMLRRKTLMNNLLSSYEIDREGAAQALRAAGLDEKVRAEHVPLGNMIALSDALVSRK